MWAGSLRVHPAPLAAGCEAVELIVFSREPRTKAAHLTDLQRHPTKTEDDSQSVSEVSLDYVHLVKQK